MTDDTLPLRRMNDGAQYEPLEAILQHYEAAAETSVKASGRLNRSLEKLRSAFVVGDIAQCIKLLQQVRADNSVLSEALAIVEQFTPGAVARSFDHPDYFAEVARISAASGLGGVKSTEGRLFSYPHVIERGALSLKLGKHVLKGIRPSWVGSQLRQLRNKSAGIDTAKLLESIYAAYVHLTSKSAIGSGLVTVNDVYELLTLLPGAQKDFTKFDLLVALHNIDRHGPHTTQTGRTIYFDASTSTKLGRADRIINDEGKEVLYSTIGFRPSGASR